MFFVRPTGNEREPTNKLQIPFYAHRRSGCSSHARKTWRSYGKFGKQKLTPRHCAIDCSRFCTDDSGNVRYLDERFWMNGFEQRKNYWLPVLRPFRGSLMVEWRTIYAWKFAGFCLLLTLADCCLWLTFVFFWGGSVKIFRFSALC